MTPLIAASRLGHISLVRILLAAGADREANSHEVQYAITLAGYE